MKTRKPFTRREFLEVTGGALSLGTMTTLLPGPADSGQDDPRSAGKNPAQLKRLIEQMEAQGTRFWSVPRKDAELLHFLIKATRAMNVLELGTSHGYSAIWMGLGLEETGGRLTTLEIDKARYDLARKNMREAGLSRRVTCLLGDAHQEIMKLDGPFDFVFLDADKEGQVDYLNKLYRKKLPLGGILAAHNAIQQSESMKDYLGLVRKHPDFDTVILSTTMEDGFCLSYRHRM
jgi:caffeoyl-CoA O-methyltransferase